MTLDDLRATYAAKSDAELRALEKDTTLTSDQWQAVMEERRRREERSAAAPPPPPRSATAPANAPTVSSVAGDPRLAQAIASVQGLLVPGETLQAWAVQRRLFALTHRREIIAATSGRFIAVRRGLFGGYTPVDMRWQDIDDARLNVGIFGADVAIRSRNREDLASAGHPSGAIVIAGLRKDQAQAVYRIAQAQEQAWREKRRVRDLDELRARSGGIQFGNAPGGGAAASGAATGDDDPVTRLQRAKEMLSNGLITDAEYESIKAKIVDRM